MLILCAVAGCVLSHCRICRSLYPLFSCGIMLSLRDCCSLSAHGVPTAAQLGGRRFFATHRWVCSPSAVLISWKNAVVTLASAVKVLKTCPVFPHRVIEFYRTQRNAMILSAEKWLKGQKTHTLLLLYFVASLVSGFFIPANTL